MKMPLSARYTASNEGIDIKRYLLRGYELPQSLGAH